MRSPLLATLWLMLVASPLLADGPADNIPDKVRRIPALGIVVPEADAQELGTQLEKLKGAIDELAKKNDPRVRELLPDVQIFYQAVHDSLKYQEFRADTDIPLAKRQLEEGLERAKQLSEGQAPWAAKTGLVVRGYVSRIDGSVQPYGLVVPESYAFSGAQKHRLDFWFHGRGENVTEVAFINDRSRNRGAFTPPDTIVLHPYARFSNGNKFAGEVDCFEALESVKRRYRIDEDRIGIRGFSMGGAAAWHIAAHFADRWVGNAPGAGYAETEKFLRDQQQETLTPPWWERKLWRLYDVTDVAVNLYHCPTVAYSGEIDAQKQAADLMAEALAKEGIDMVHIIGPRTGHAYHPEARAEIDRRFDLIAAKGREKLPHTLHFVTHTLKYDRMHWVKVEGLAEHWEPARVDGQIQADGSVTLKTTNITDLLLTMAPGACPFEITAAVPIVIDGQKLAGMRPKSDRSWDCPLHRNGTAWVVGPRATEGLRKAHDLQGPIDDAFMDSFLIVRPTGKARSEAVDAWVRAEMDHAIVQWRQQFRGHPRVKDDKDVTDADVASSNLILWGDPESNAQLKKIADKLPIAWGEANISAGARQFPGDKHVAILIYPNPLNPKKYVVLNSGFTYREYDYLNNARQVPKLPDWAIVDVTRPPDSRYPGKIVTADFFGERWQLRPPRQ